MSILFKKLSEKEMEIINAADIKMPPLSDPVEIQQINVTYTCSYCEKNEIFTFDDEHYLEKSRIFTQKFLSKAGWILSEYDDPYCGKLCYINGKFKDILDNITGKEIK